MSKTVDERVVSMQFDNKHFESNVQTTMSTLDKLKQKLHLDGASKGLENVDAAAKKVDMSGLSNGVETVRAKFSALDVMGVTALANITNSAVEAGKKIVSALTIDPIKTGFEEYETQINAVQTILANTQSKGSTIDDVNTALEELNKYADKTIYNFTEMTRNIGTFTAAGVDLDTSVNAIQGIANLAAVSGSTSQQASTAMYQLSQALASGTVKLMDWNSVVNAGMGGQVFQDSLKETARIHGVAIDEMIESEGSFRETLKNEWLTADILTETLQKFTLTTEGLTEEQIKANREMLRSKGYTEEQIEEIFKLGNTATEAATKVKTFTQLWDVLKESAQSGWSQTWKLIIGDYEEAKGLLSPLADFLTGFINKMSDFRNRVIDIALNNPFAKLLDKIKAITDTTKKAANSMKDLGDIVNRVIRGEFGNQGDNGDRNYRAKKLTAAGYDYATVQNLVNEKLGSSVRLTSTLTEKQGELAKAQGNSNKAQATSIEQLLKKTDAQLEELGLTKEEIQLLRELQVEAKKSGVTVEELIEGMGDMDGRTMLIESFKNAGKGLVTVFQAMKDAFLDAFPVSATSLALKLNGAIQALYNLSKKWDISKDTNTIDKLTRTFKGLFAALDIILTVVGGPIKIAFKILGQLLSAFDLNILDITAVVGDAIVGFRDWLESVLDFTGVFKWLAPYVLDAVSAIKKWFASLKDSETVKQLGEWLKNAAASVRDWIVAAQPLKKVGEFFKSMGAAISKWFESIKNSDIAKDILAGLSNGLQNGAKGIWDAIVNIATGLINKVKEVLGIHSPSTVFMAIGGFIVAGLLLGLTKAFPSVGTTIQGLFDKIVSTVGNIDFGAIFTGLLAGGTAITGFKLAGALENLTAPLEGVSDLLGGVGKFLVKIAPGVNKTLKGLGKTLRGFGSLLSGLGFEHRMKGVLLMAYAIKELAIAFAIVAASLAILSLFDQGKVWSATGAIAVLAAMMIGIIVALDKANIGSKLSIAKVSLTLLALSVSLLIAANAVRKIAELEWEDWAKGLGGVVILAGVIVGIMAATKLISGSKNVDKIGGTLIKVVGAIAVMVLVAKILGEMDKSALDQGLGAILSFGLIMVGLMAATKLISGSKNVDKIGSTLIKISAALLVMVYVAKIAGEMSREALIQGGLAILAFSGIIVGLMAATKLITGSKHVDTIGGTILKIAAALLAMVLVAKIAGGMSTEELVQGGLAILAFSGIIVGLMAATKLVGGGKNAAKIGGTILAIAGAMLIMVLVAKIAGSMEPDSLAKGLIAIIAFGGIIVGLMAATKLVGGSKNATKMGLTILAFAAAIGIMAGVAALLGMMKTENLVKGIAAIAALGGIMAGLIAVTKNAKKCKDELVVLTVAIGVMALAIAGLSFIDPARLAAATLALSAVMGMFALVVKASASAKKGIGVLIVLTVAIGVMGGVLYLLGQLPVENALGASAALSVLMLTLSAALLILSGVGKFAKDALMGVLALTAMAIPLLAFVGVLALMQNVQNVLPNVIALTLLATAMTALLIPLTIVGAFGMAGLPYLGVLALLAMAVPMLAFVGVLALMQNIQNAQANANLLIGLMTVMTGMLVILAIVGPLALIGVTAIAALTTVIVAVGALAVAIGALMQQFPALQSFLDTGLNVLIQLAGGIGEMIGAFIGGIATQIASTLPGIGLALSQFMINATPFIIGVKMVDSSVLEGVGILAAAVLALTAADFISGVFSFLQGGSSFADLGTELSNFMINATPFIMMANMIKPEIMTGIKSLAEAILILTGANMVETITGWLGGGSSLATFGSQLGQLGTDMSKFVTNLGTFTEDQVTTVDCAGRAIKALADAAKGIPNDGGWLGAIVGENSLATFGGYLPGLGSNLSKFVTNLGTFTEDQVTTVDCAGRAIKALAEAANEIPNEGGIWASIVGDNSLATFGSALPQLGSDLSGFISKLGTFGDDSITTVNCACEAIKGLASAANSIPNEGGLWAKIVGDNSLATFGEKLPGLGEDIAEFVNKLGNFGEGGIDTVNSACNAIKAIAGLGKIDLGDTSSGLEKLGKKLGGFADKLSSFVDKMGKVGASNIDSAITKTKDLIDLAKTAAGTNVDSLKTFGESLKKVATDGVEGFVKAFTGETPKTKVKNAAKDLLNAFIKAAEGKKNDVNTAFKDIASAASTKIATKDMKAKFETAGKDLVTGFANGIKNNKSLATDAGSALGKAALAAAKEALDENSPSKEMYKVGDFAGIGFVNALVDNISDAYHAGFDVAKSAKDGLSKAIARVSDVIDSDIDTQPTIRPVLDLSDVQAGAATIGGMFSGRTLSVDTRAVGSIASAMAVRQNGFDSGELASAIKALRKDLAENPRTVNNINGITYDDGSNINDAVATLVRAARVERRS